MAEKCAGTTKSGEPCGMNPTARGRYCFNHARGGAAAQARAAARSAGGKARQARAVAHQELAGEAQPRPHWWALREPWEVAAALAHATRELLAGRLDAKRGALVVKALSHLAPLVRKYARADDDGDGTDFDGEEREDDADEGDDA